MCSYATPAHPVQVSKCSNMAARLQLTALSTDNRRQRPTMFSTIEQYIPKFPNITKQRKLDLILRWFYIDNPDFLSLNTTLAITVQNYTPN